MAPGSNINIVSGLPQEFSSNFTVGGITYHAQTEDMGTRTCKIISRIYLKGEVLLTRKSDYAYLVKLKDYRERLRAMIESHHKATIDLFSKGMARGQKTKSDYFDEVQRLMRKRQGKTALRVIREGLGKFPDDPFLMSHFGFLVAVVENRPADGINICHDAIAGLKEKMPLGSEFFFPVFYLNLGRAYLKAGDRGNAIEAFREGLVNDPENHDLLWEFRKLGIRKSPLIPFLRRSSPVNKYIGILVSKVSR